MLHPYHISQHSKFEDSKPDEVHNHIQETKVLRAKQQAH